MKKWMLLVLLVTVVGGGGYFWWSLTGVQPLHEKALTFAEVRQATIRDIVSATGEVHPREIVLVSSEMPGTVVHIWGRDEKTSIPLGIGDTVVEGAPLVQLDDRKILLKIEEAKTGIKTANSAVLQAEAALVQAKANLSGADRYLKTQMMLEKSGGFRSERDQAEAQVEAAAAGIKLAEAGIKVAESKKQAAQTALQEAELARDMTRIKVPGKSGREFLILDRKANIGQLVGPQTGPLFTLAGSLDLVEVHAQVVEGDVNKIREGLTAIFRITGYDDEETEFDGTVRRIRPMSNTIKGASYFNAIIEVKNRKDPKSGEWQLRPGNTLAVDIVRREVKYAWRVPVAALNFKLDEAYQSEAAKAHVAQWKKRADEKDWQALWIWDAAAGQPAPVFVRIGGKLKDEVGLKDSEGNQILEWEPGKEPTAPLRVIIFAPPARPPGFFDQPANVKI